MPAEELKADVQLYVWLTESQVAGRLKMREGQPHPGEVLRHAAGYRAKDKRSQRLIRASITIVVAIGYIRS